MVIRGVSGGYTMSGNNPAKASNVVQSLRQKDLPTNPVYLTLDILIEYGETYGRFPTYRETALVLDELLEKPVKTSTATVYRYLHRLEDEGLIEWTGHRYRVTGSRITYAFA